VDANIIFGVVFDDKMEDRLQVTVIATGFNRSEPAAEIREFQAARNVVLEEVVEDIERPTIDRRKHRSASTEHRLDITSFETFTMDELQVPTFLRRQMD